LVVEAVFEDLDLKRKIVADVEAVTPDHCIFATNTSAIPISEIAVGAKRPQNIIGMHYFSPVPSMPLLEIIPHKGTSDAATATAFEVGSKQGKTCIVVKDVPGFYVNRCLGPFLVEVSALVRDGVELEAVVKAMQNFGMHVDPITLADEVGIDVTSHQYLACCWFPIQG
jgi:enoyl-CoA hydratase/long-chain 3-hydroxyacyl-CoA dehydrogenase